MIGPTVVPDEDSPEFGSADDAADAVSRNFGGNEEFEQAAVIFQRPDGSHVYSTVAPQESRNSFYLRAELPDEWKLSGIIHTHPSQEEAAQWFSPEDVKVSIKLGVPSYIKFWDGSIRKFTPGETETEVYCAVDEGQRVIAGYISHGDPSGPRVPAASRQV